MNRHLTLQPSARSALCLLVIFLVDFAACHRATAEPVVPKDDALVLEVLPRAVGYQDRETARLREALAQNPRSLKAALALARHYREIGRAESDPRFFGYAQAALAPWWRAAEPPKEVMILRAILRQAWHDFEGARADLERVLARDPGNAQALLVQATVLAATGNYRAAAANCRALRHHGLIAAACLSHSESLVGRARPAYARLALAASAGASERPAVRVWALTILGEIAQRLGAAAAAEDHFRSALALGERSAYLLAAYADLLLDQGRFSEVRRLLRDETRTDGLLLRLAIAEDRLGDPAGAGHARALQARFAAARARGSSIHLREEARFALHTLGDPLRALRLARENWQTQREPWDARLVLEAALAAGRPEEARPVVAWLKDHALEDRRIEPLLDRLAEKGA